MPRPRRSIEDALEQARVFDGEYTRADLDASRHRITEELTEFRWMQLLAADGPTRARAGRLPTSLHERAAHDLRALCQSIVHAGDAARRIARFDDVRDPGGALAFACLLILAGKDEGAQFWLQYAAGAGNVTGALCLYLLHLRRGERRDAQYWAGQIAQLEAEPGPCQYMPVAHEVVTTTGAATGIAVHYALPQAEAAVAEDAVKDAVDELDAPRLDGLGPIPQPSADLADQWDDLVTR
ncbi:hypothetical protein ABT160_24465 [Streptomyces sp. NPDC001941]|uniref:hypothetical protein n=1 Tax=Streptomyces sp. NPDC001941 TaxID=3154659 RepID=UPI00331713DD